VINFIALTGQSLIIYDMVSNKEEKITKMYDAGFLLYASTMNGSAMLCVVILAKLCNDNTRGTIFFFGGLIGSFFILFI